MLTHLLDTSAWLAHIFDEPGASFITALIADGEMTIGISSMSLLETHARFRQLGRAAEFGEMRETYRDLFDQVLAVDEVVVLQAIVVRESASTRLPAIDSLIAATASLHGAILIHRDAHFLSIPDALLSQQILGAD